MAMDQEQLQGLHKEAHRLLLRDRDYEAAFRVYKRLADADDVSACFTCGLFYENGWLKSGKDLDLALSYYRKLAIKWNDDEGYLGIARIIFLQKNHEELDTAIRFCKDVLSNGLRARKRLAFVLLGRIYEDMSDPPEHKSARKAYLKAFMCGNAYSLRLYARSLVKSRDYIGGFLMHVIATVVCPVMVLFLGRGASRQF